MSKHPLQKQELSEIRQNIFFARQKLAECRLSKQADAISIKNTSQKKTKKKLRKKVFHQARWSNISIMQLHFSLLRRIKAISRSRAIELAMTSARTNLDQKRDAKLHNAIQQWKKKQQKY